NPNYVPACTNLGITLYETGNIELALQMFKRAAALDPCNPASHINLGNIYGMLNRNKKAAACFEEAVEFDPEDSTARFWLGSTFLMMGETTKALHHLEEAEREMKDFAPLYYNLSIAAEAEGYREASRKAMDKALELNPALGKDLRSD
ncbi:MAG: tetratricopeptide repeat protein, partial [Planctomycetota bacterium]